MPRLLMLILALTCAVIAVIPATANAVLVFQRTASNAIVAAQDDGGRPRVLAHGQYPVVSPDGRYVVFVASKRSAYGPIRVVNVRTRRQRTLLREGGPPRGKAGTWAPDGRWVVVGGDVGVDARVVRVKGWSPRRVRLGDYRLGDYQFGGAEFSPDGRRLLIERDTIKDSDVRLYSLRRLRPRRANGRQLPAWGARGVASYFTDASVYDPGTYAAINVAPDPARPGREVLRAPTLGPPVAWSADGSRLLLTDSPSSGGTKALLLDPATGATQTLPAALQAVAALSRDGTSVLAEANGDVVSEDLAGTVTVLAPGATSPTWTR